MANWYKYSLIVVLLIGSVLPTIAFAYQFGDLKWGTPKEELYKRASEAGKIIIENSDTTLIFLDTMLDKPCQISFKFTPKTKLLFYAAVKWNDRGAGIVLYGIIKESYGLPTGGDYNLYVYKWGQPGEDTIELHYTFYESWAIFTSGQYTKQDALENAEVTQQNAEANKENVEATLE